MRSFTVSGSGREVADNDGTFLPFVTTIMYGVTLKCGWFVCPFISSCPP